MSKGVKVGVNADKAEVTQAYEPIATEMVNAILGGLLGKMHAFYLEFDLRQKRFAAYRSDLLRGVSPALFSVPDIIGELSAVMPPASFLMSQSELLQLSLLLHLHDLIPVRSI